VESSPEIREGGAHVDEAHHEGVEAFVGGRQAVHLLQQQLQLVVLPQALLSHLPQRRGGAGAGHNVECKSMRSV
jgi:hypothetical protein